MRCIAEHVQAILVGSGWHPSLFRSEMEILCRKRPFRFGTRVMLADSNYDFFEDLKRSATLDECLSPFGLTTDITSLEAVIEGWINDKNIYKGIHFIPQTYWICDENKKIMVDFIARLETINQDFLFIANKVGSTKKKIEKINTSERSQYRNYYSDKTIEIVKNIYKDDIELFGYDYEN